jgi:seryl-tRNA synthetase
MFDLKAIRDDPEAFDAGLGRRRLEPHADKVLAIDGARREAISTTQALQTERNAKSKAIGAAKGKGEDASELIAAVGELKSKMQAGEERVRALDEEIETLLSGIPNIPAADVPDGPDETANVEVRRIGEPRALDFTPRQHFELGEALGLMDFEAAARMSGARFVVLSGALARLERAIASFMLDLQTSEHGYRETRPPYLVRDDALFGTGQLPKFAEDQFATKDGFWLIPTAEVPLTNLVREQIVDEADLPMRVTAHTPCFRAEAGAAGKDTRGMIRLHQFDKVELVSIVAPGESDAELERMTGCAEEVLKRLDLPYRVVMLSTGDMGFSARKTYDLEVWLPGQDTYREISSCSTCGDFQARRMNARYRPAEGKGTAFVHTLNGSGLAVGRTLVAVLENYQNADGTITVPEALRSYMGGIDVIGPQ